MEEKKMRKGQVEIVMILLLIAMIIIIGFLVSFWTKAAHIEMEEGTRETGIKIGDVGITNKQTLESANQTRIDEFLNKPTFTEIGINILIVLLIIFMIVKIIKESKK